MTPTDDFVHISDVLADLFGGTERVPTAREHTDLPDSVLSLLEDADFMLPTARIGIVLGRPGVGKSSLLLTCAVNVASQGHGVAYICPESTQPTLALRLISHLAQENESRIRERWTKQTMRPIVAKGVQRGRDLPMYVSTGSWVSSEALADELLESIQRHRIKLMVLDYLQLVLPDRDNWADEIAIEAAMRPLQRLAKLSGTAILAAYALPSTDSYLEAVPPLLSELPPSLMSRTEVAVALTPQFRAESEFHLMHTLVSADANLPRPIPLRFLPGEHRFEVRPWERA